MYKYLVVLFLFLYQSSFAQQPPYEEILNAYNSQNNFNGVVLIATDGKIDYLQAKGVADRKTGAPVTPSTKFKIASVTKAFTAVLILQLKEEGKLNLQDSFGKYFPTYKGVAKNQVTIEQLLTYSSGISDKSEKLEMLPYQKATSLDEFIDTYLSGPLDTIPGIYSKYSNLEYILLHKIIENITGNSYGEVLQEKILNPLKMENTGMLHSKKKIPNLTASYTYSDSTKKLGEDIPYLIENFYGAGAMYSTAEDLLKFDLGIFQHKLFGKATTALMIAPNKKLNDVAFGVWYASGYGIFNKPFIYRTGGILGSCSNWIHTLEDKISIIVLNNTNGTNLYELSEKLYKLVKMK